ncbi:hypothetical protein HRI_001897600 [Hibiscus trionum]|uniref:Bulb-type lectin domain-containing protein n=1 Tax=Hibiscus trionum TaxID=183268 RepID=A0A9W7HT44_HIBTR|nr:hypothetical protein HRI_001897600 [Hibiscus trionum]
MAYFGLMQSIIISSFFLSFVVASLPDSTLYFSKGNRTTWTNNNQSLPQAIHFTDGSLARFILLKTETSTNGSFGFGFGFYCNCPYVGYCDLSIMFVDMLNGEVDLKGRPQVVWTANWNRRIRENATLKYNQGGNLSLIDEHDNGIWSAYPSGVSNVFGMSMDERGNVMLFNESIQPVWESSQHPTDTLLLGQVIRANQQLTSRAIYFHARQGLFNLSLNSRAIVAFSVGDEATQYLTISPAGADAVPWKTEEVPYLKFVQFIKGGMAFYYQKKDQIEKLYLNAVNSSSNSATIQFLRLDVDGGLRIYGWNPGEQWRSIYFWPNKSDECWIPLRCGRYGVCKWGICGCPNGPDGKDYFTLRDYQHPHLGCREISPSVAFQGASTDYEMVHFGNLSYSSTFYTNATHPRLTTEENCKQACYDNTTCKAAFFVSKEIGYEGSCYLYSDSETLSLMGNPHEGGYYLSSYLKVTSLKLKVNASSPGQGFTNFHSYSWGKTPLAVYSFLLTMVVLVALCFLLWMQTTEASQVTHLGISNKVLRSRTVRCLVQPLGFPQG